MPITKMNGKKDGKQQYRVRVNYTDANGNYKRIERTAYGAAEAKLLETQLSQSVQEKSTVTKMTVQKLYNEYMSAKSHEVRESTLDKSRQVLEHHVLPYLGKTALDRLNTAALQKWKNNISELSVSIKTKQNIYKELRTMLNYGVRMDYFPKSPLAKIGNFSDPYFVTQQEKLHYYTPEQYKKFARAAHAAAESAGSLTDWGYYVFFSIAFYTGMRKGEINALKWSDIDGDVLHVRRSIAQKLKGGDRETPPKNKSSYRDLQIPIPLMEILDEHKKRQQELSGFSDNYRVCGGTQCLRDTSLANKNIQFADDAGLPHIRIHDFRHSHASLLVNEGINIQEIARRLGHSKIEITWNTYAHLYPREEERAIQILNKIR